MSHAAPTAPTLPGETGIRSAETLYIHQHVETQRAEQNTWKKAEVFPYGKLLGRSTRSHKVTQKRINNTNILFYHSGTVVGSFDSMVTSLVSHQARKACSSRSLSRSCLKASGLSVPEGKVFPVAHAQNALAYQQQLSTPVTIRPVSGRARRGFSAGILTEDQLAYAWEDAAEACASLPAMQRQVLVEKHSDGLDLRMYVVGETVSAALVRLPFYAVGDGASTLAQLQENLAEEIARDSYLAPPSAEHVEGYLSHWGRSLSHVPETGEVVPLSETTSAQPGHAITVDVTHTVASELKQLAVDAMWAFPGLSASGVDLRVRGTGNAENAAIIDVDPAADISEFRYPTYGKHRRVSVDIIGQMVQQSSR